MKYKHIVFDIDNTLINTEYAVLHSLQKTIEQITSKRMDISDLLFTLGIPGKDALLQLGIDNIEKVHSLWEKNMSHYFDTMKVFDGIESLLHELNLMGYSLGVITSKTRVEYNNDFIPFGLTKYLDISICADDTKEHKPNPEPIQKYLELSNISNRDMLYVGDSLYDMKCAFSASVDCCLAIWGCHFPEIIEATYRINNPQELYNIL